MRQILIRSPGGYDRLECVTRPDPEPGPGEVLIRTRAIGVNYADCIARMGLYASARELIPVARGTLPATQWLGVIPLADPLAALELLLVGVVGSPELWIGVGIILATASAILFLPPELISRRA